MADPLAVSSPAAEAPATEVNAFEELLRIERKFEPKSDKTREGVQAGIQALAERALDTGKVLSQDTYKYIEELIAEIDTRLSAQLDAVLHHENFKTLEGTWRGLQRLVFGTESDETLKIRVLDISKKELSRTLSKFADKAFDQSPIFKKIYEHEFGTLGGTPYSCLVGDYYFDQSAPDVELLANIAKVAATAHAPFITAAAPKLLNMSSWQELNNPRDLTKIFDTPEYAQWTALRKSEDARYLGLTMPRFLGRLPYDPTNNPVDEFAFKETVDGTDDSKYLWSNSAYAMAMNITRAFKLHGWCSRIRGVESGGLVEGLPCHTFKTSDGKIDMKCPTEVAITDRREAELAKNGMIPFVHRKNTNQAVFIGAQSVQQPAKYEDPAATGNAQLAARLPYLFATCRFAHYLKCMARDMVGRYASREDMERGLRSWINNYVSADSTASEEAKCEFPLAEANVVVEEVPGNPGFYTSKFFLRPHYQLEGLTVSLRLVTKLPVETGK